MPGQRLNVGLDTFGQSDTFGGKRLHFSSLSDKSVGGLAGFGSGSGFPKGDNALFLKFQIVGEPVKFGSGFPRRFIAATC